MDGYAYPNEAEVGWSLLIVLYPYVTGLVAGAFVVSSLYHVFNVRALKPVASLSLVTALAFVLAAPLPLQAHLGRPERAFEIFLTPSATSAMAGFGYIWAFYTILVATEVWLVFRPDIVHYARTSLGWRRDVYRILALGVTEMTVKGRRADERLIKILATAGIPAACILHGYVGFLFGGIKANPWWSTALMPIIFLLSAIVSGIALLIVMYVFTCWIRGMEIDHECVRTLSRWLLSFLIIDVAIEGLELLNMFYESEDTWPIVSELITERLLISFVGIQFLFGSLIPLAVLLVLAIPGPVPGKGWLYTFPDKIATRLTAMAATISMVGIFAMRWNVVIGGQLLSKSFRGMLTYEPPVGGREGILATLLLFAIPFYLFWVITRIIPPWDRPNVVADPESVELPPVGRTAPQRESREPTIVAIRAAGLDRDAEPRL